MRMLLRMTPLGMAVRGTAAVLLSCAAMLVAPIGLTPAPDATTVLKWMLGAMTELSPVRTSLSWLMPTATRQGPPEIMLFTSVAPDPSRLTAITVLVAQAPTPLAPRPMRFRETNGELSLI